MARLGFPRNIVAFACIVFMERNEDKKVVYKIILFMFGIPFYSCSILKYQFLFSIHKKVFSTNFLMFHIRSERILLSFKIEFNVTRFFYSIIENQIILLIFSTSSII